MPEHAEIEAVARIIEKWCKRDMPTAYDCATEILDRVRDARGECLLHSRNLLAEFGAARADDPAAAES
jgi:hypothetical protein